MEKIITCKKCRKTFKIFGSPSKAKEESHIAGCPFCGQSNDVMWPKDTVFTTIPKPQITR
jgi:hypothetical protein